ncbi:MAG TPA: MauE/DoxX family redox-associated membrane protein [Candidatus Methanoperedens sp.]|nr:MauE/DoxX family redox-associated membrane protein [Candidatus Methanoperedens sp.]
MRAAATGLTLLLRAALGGIFLLSGLAKIADPVAFLFSLRQFRLLPGPLEAWLALVLPWLEFLLGLLLISGLLYRTAALMIAALNVFFACAILTVVARGIEIDCGCFGLLARALPLPDQADLTAVLRNLVFAGCGVLLFRQGRSPLTLEGYLEGRRSGLSA